MTYLPLQFFVDQIDEVLEKSFSLSRNDFFFIIANRVLSEKSLNIQKDFHVTEFGSFKDFCRRFLSYSYFVYNSRVNFYTRFTQKTSCYFHGVIQHSNSIIPNSIIYVKNIQFYFHCIITKSIYTMAKWSINKIF